MSIESQNDQVLAKLYKKGAKQTPSSELDRKILDYAANKNKPVRGSSHFGGGWKVPLSLAASVVLVFAILVQLDQSPEQLEIPPTPTTDKSDSMSAPMDEITTEEFKDSVGDSVGVDSDIEFETEGLSGRTETQAPSSAPQRKLESRKKLESQDSMSHPETSLEKSRQFDDFKLNNELEMNQESQASPPSTKSKASNAPASEPTQQSNKQLEHMQDISKDAPNENKKSTIQESSRSNNGAAVGSMSRERGKSVEDNQNQQAQEPVIQNREDSFMAKEEADFAPIPVEDWLLMIEKLIARKDYAEADRQLKKFKQAHPKVNVEDLESKIP